MNMILGFLKLLLPPIDKNDPHLTTWRFLMAGGVLIALGYIFVAEGIILGGGHARASELAEVRTTLDAIKLDGLEQSIERWHGRRCKAEKTSNQEFKVVAQEELRRRLQEYLRLTGDRYILFVCDER